MLGVEMADDAPDDVTRAIDSLITDNMIFSDNHESNRTDVSSYWAVRLMGYGFLGIIALISFSGIVNSMAMSAAALMKQYGAMRAVGLDGGQLTGMLLAEAMTYALSGLLVGFALVSTVGPAKRMRQMAVTETISEL